MISASTSSGHPACSTQPYGPRIRLNGTRGREQMMKPYTSNSGRRASMKGKLLNLLNRWKHTETFLDEEPYDGSRGSQLSHFPKADTSIAQGFQNTMGQSQVIQDFLNQSGRAAESDCHILLTAEPGTEKDLLAYFIHEKSPRRFQPFVKIDCIRQASDFLHGTARYCREDSILEPPPPLIDQLTMLEHGTLFLDEIGTLSIEHQANLLRWLLHNESSIADTRPMPNPGIRIIASTRRDLRLDVATKKFRADLFYRLNVIPLRIPPLRDRLDDIPILTNHFMKKHAGKHEKTIVEVSENTLQVFLTYAWPGNTRELETVVERGVVLARGSVLDIQKSALGLRTSP